MVPAILDMPYNVFFSPPTASSLPQTCGWYLVVPGIFELRLFALIFVLKSGGRALSDGEVC